MEFEINELKERVNLYFEAKISKDALGQWAKEAYQDILRGGYVEKKKIVSYSFLKKVSEINIVADDIRDEYPCTAEEINEIRDILCGKRDFRFLIDVQIPLQVYGMFKDNRYLNSERRLLFLELRDMIKEIENTKMLNGNEISQYIEKICLLNIKR